MEAIREAKGSYTFKTIDGEELTAMIDGNQFLIKILEEKNLKLFKAMLMRQTELFIT